MIINKKGGLEYLTFENMKDVKHCFSTRNGGVSEGCYRSLNLAYRDDKKENVIENYRRICDAIDVESSNVVWTRQVHEDRVIAVDERDRGKGLFLPREEQGYDGIITNCRNVVLTGFSADCVLIYYYEPKKGVIGIAHSGWRGTVKSIGAKTVDKMAEYYGVNREDILVGIAPAIGVCCFQVDESVVDEFEKELPWSVRYITKDDRNDGKYYIDLHSINEYILVQSGVKSENIENSRICTMCNKDMFYSHRTMGNERGSMAGLISLS